VERGGRSRAADREGLPAVFVFEFFVPAVGLAASPFGVPVNVTRIHVSQSRVSAPSISVLARYAVGEPAELGGREAALSAHPSAYWMKDGRLRHMVGGYHGLVWRRAELDGEPHFGPVALFGVDPGRPDYALYADRTELRANLPTRRA